MEFKHISAMPDEVQRYLDVRPGGIYVDGTLGGAGHACEICRRMQPGGKFVGIDQDIDAVRNAEIKLSSFESDIHIVNDNFANLPRILSELNIQLVDGILIDIGVSQHQLQGSGRGFSFNRDEPLDMRMDQGGKVTAESIVNGFDERELTSVFFTYGEERFSRKIAAKIVEARKIRPVTTSKMLADIVESAVPVKFARQQKIHPATRVFQAIRIKVNEELKQLETFMDCFHQVLKPGGRLVVLTFHSLEDRIVKSKIKLLEKECTCPRNFPKCVCDTKKIVKRITGKPVIPGQDEIRINPMARSTKLRACEKI
jgi:16S rRNA (cytosine1402-N4)-methyltransferase